ncbi:MAG: putative phage abortive infection protein [Sphingobacteriales bacterium]
MKNDPYEDTPQPLDSTFALVARLFIFIGAGLFFVVMCNSPDAGNNAKDYWTVWGTRGDFTAGMVGTLFALSGFIYVYLSFKKQREANELQAEAFKHEKVESRFFKLLGLHRNNVSELSFKYHSAEVRLDEKSIPYPDKVEHELSNRQVFQAIKKQFFDLLDEVGFLFEEEFEEDIYEPTYLQAIQVNTTYIQRKTDPNLLAKVDLLYLIVFFGVSLDGRNTIYSLSEGRYKQAFLNKLLGLAMLKPKVNSKYFEKWWRINTSKDKQKIFWALHIRHIDSKATPKELKPFYFVYGDVQLPFDPYYPNDYEKYYGGHQFRLGHYFRHLFQTVGFIHHQKNLLPMEKYDYIRHLRGQLSTDEEIVLFLNSISQLGRVWDLETKKDHSPIPIDDQLISTYHLIKNIPADQIKADIKLSAFYPEIDYEGFN